MNQRTMTELVRMQTFEQVYRQYQDYRFGCEDAAALLGCSVRTFHRHRERYDEGGIESLQDKRVGRISSRRAGDAEVALVTRLYEAHYRGWSVKQFHEFLQQKHAVHKSYTWTRNVLASAGLVMPEKRGGPHRLRRPRRPMAGMLVHQDASKHNWFGDMICDLVVTMDDATSEITSAFFCEEEGTLSSFQGLEETIQSKGRFCEFYTDRGSHYFHTPEAGGKVSKAELTQVGRALKQLNIKHIAAYSPQARGRSERMFQTLQDRLVKELAIAGITTMEAANRFLKHDYLPRHNARFMVKPESAQPAWVPLVGFDLKEILCIQEERTVGHDNTVRYNGLKLQIPPSPHRHHYVRAKVRVHQYSDGSLALFHGPLELGRYDRQGRLLIPPNPAQQAAA